MNTFLKKRCIQVYGQDVVRYALKEGIKNMEGRKEGRKKSQIQKKKKRLEETDRTVKWLSLNDGVG